MTDAEYKATQEALVIVAGMISGLDLNGFMARIKLAVVLGPIADPTLYKKGMDKLIQVRRLASAAMRFQGEVHRQQEEARKAG